MVFIGTKKYGEWGLLPEGQRFCHSRDPVGVGFENLEIRVPSFPLPLLSPTPFLLPSFPLSSPLQAGDVLSAFRGFEDEQLSAAG